MRLSRNELRKIELEEAQKTGKSAAQMEDAKRRAMGRIEDRHREIMAKIKELQDQRHDIVYAPPTKEALAKTLKKALLAQKDFIRGQYLRKHIEACQKSSNVKPFDGSSMAFTFAEDKAWRLAPFCISDEDIDYTVSLLDEIGITEEEREKRLKEIDRQIDHLFKKVKKSHDEV